MGASRPVLLRQFLVESVLLSLLGCGVGLLLAFWGVKILFAAYPGSVPRAAEVGLDATVLLFSLATALVTGVLFGLSPLLHLTRSSLGAALREGGRRTTSGRRALRQAVVISEIAVAVMLVVACGLLLRSFWTMQDVDAGFRADGLTTFQIYLPESTYPDPASEVGFLRDLSARLREIPGVESATAMTGLPPRRRLNANDMDFEGVPETEEGPPHNVDYWNFVLEDYFETMQIPILEGRPFEPSDDGSAPVAIVNETMARTFWPGTSPLGRRVRPGGDGMPWITVVGIARDVKQAGLEEETGTEAYFFYPQVAVATGFAPREMNVVLRSSLPPDSVAESARQAVWARDEALPLAGLRSMDEVLRDSLTRPRFVTLLVVVFAGLALLLAAVGTYGVLSYTVAERTSEIGIRMALGAGASRVLEIVLAQGMVLTGAGLVLGMAGALLLARFLESFLFGVEPTDALTLLSVPFVLLLVALAACAVPAYRAMRVSPVEALRCE